MIEFHGKDTIASGCYSFITECPSNPDHVIYYTDCKAKADYLKALGLVHQDQGWERVQLSYSAGNVLCHKLEVTKLAHVSTDEQEDLIWGEIEKLHPLIGWDITVRDLSLLDLKHFPLLAPAILFTRKTFKRSCKVDIDAGYNNWLIHPEGDIIPYDVFNFDAMTLWKGLKKK